MRDGCVAKTPGAQNGVRVASGAPGAAVMWRTWSAQSALQVSLSGNHCSRCFWVQLEEEVQSSDSILVNKFIDYAH